MTKEEIIQGLYKGDSRAIKEAVKVLEQQQPSEDCVSRKAILEMIEQIEDAGGFIGYSTYSEVLYQVNNMSPITPKLSTSDDCVSRQAVLDMAITIQTDDYSGNKILDVVEVEDIEDIRALPPVTPTRKSGLRWIERFDNEDKWLECPHCHKDSDNAYVYCPNCGASFKEEKRGNENGSN